MDAFAVSLGIGSDDQFEGGRPWFRISFHFGFFQFLLPIVGWFAGANFVKYIENYDHWIAFLLLVFVGARMIRSGFNGSNSATLKDPSRGWTMVLLSVAVSIDALAVGFSLADEILIKRTSRPALKKKVKQEKATEPAEA